MESSNVCLSSALIQLLVWKIQCRQSLITDSDHGVIANSLTSSTPVSGYCKAADVDGSLRACYRSLAFGFHERLCCVVRVMETGREGSYGDVFL